MKKLILPLFLGILLLSSCDQMNDKKFGTTLYQDFEISLDGTTTTFSFDSLRTTLENQELAAAKEGIKSYKVKSIKYKPWEVYTDESGEQVLLNGTLGFSKNNSSTPEIEIPLENLDLNTLTNEAHQTLSISQAQLDQLADYLLAGNELKVYFNGALSTSPAHTKFQFIIDVEAVAEIEK